MLTDELRPRGRFIIAEILVLSGLGFQIFRVPSPSPANEHEHEREHEQQHEQEQEQAHEHEHERTSAPARALIASST